MFEHCIDGAIAPEVCHTLPQEGIRILDLRDAASYAYGHLQGAEQLSELSAAVENGTLPRGCAYLLYCTDGS